MTPRLLGSLLQYIVDDAPNIRVVRIASRVPLQAPERISEELIGILGIYKSLRIELGIHINHASELFPEVKEALGRLQGIGLTVYCQSVLLKGLNDSQRDLAELYDELRRMRIEPHYLFHAVPMKGMGHHRTSLNRGLQLAEELVNSGEVTGRAKPMYTAMTDVGKITLYDGVVLERKGADVLLQSAYSYESRREWNPQWVLPPSAFIDPAGKLRVWYLDGVD
jgi:lysine 2,3-aminomutase